MTVTIDPATAAHAVPIAGLKQQVWPRETTDVSQIARVLHDPNHRTHVAVEDAGRIVGFVDSFSTRRADGCLRWELDLLAVHPACQGQKIGQRLIRAATDAGFQMGAALARALVQIDNRASQGALQRCGYRRDDRVLQLMVSTHSVDSEAVLPDGAVLIPVTTMNYSGLWLEGAIDALSIQAAQAVQTRAAVDLVGTLLPSDSDDLLAQAEALGFGPVEQFQWWVHPRP
ncbi:MAG: GNAT family N-acetyltransferase [Anaerolineae bacterium]|nr:GNAT family N-acetyltransferase [Anaerolineae bacterium]